MRTFLGTGCAGRAPDLVYLRHRVPCLPGEKLPSWQAAAALVRKIAENYKLPYYTLSPTYSVCADHGYLSGEQYTCPHLRPYHRGVQPDHRLLPPGAELERRQDPGVQGPEGVRHLRLPPAESRTGGAQVTAPVEPTAAAEGMELMLFTTRTCPNCRQAESLLQRRTSPTARWWREESPELATRYGVRQAPHPGTGRAGTSRRSSPGWGPSRNSRRASAPKRRCEPSPVRTSTQRQRSPGRSLCKRDLSVIK